MKTNTTKAVQIVTPPPKLTLCEGFALTEGAAQTTHNDMARPTNIGLHGVVPQVPRNDMENITNIVWLRA